MKVVKRTVYRQHLPDMVEVEGVIQEFKDEVSLFRSKRLWWLAYKDNDHNTGPFKTKKAAISWYEKGGR